MKSTTLHLYHLLKEDNNTNIILLELLKLKQKKSISDTLEKYILSKKQISYDFYQSVSFGIHLYQKYEKETILINC